eukprot:2130876-Rhodomonas_salina.5
MKYAQHHTTPRRRPSPWSSSSDAGNARRGSAHKKWINGQRCDVMRVLRTVRPASRCNCHGEKPHEASAREAPSKLVHE